MLKISIETGNSAFDDYPGTECARILRQLADRIDGIGRDRDESGFLYDFNGNRVGEWSLDLEGDE